MKIKGKKIGITIAAAALAGTFLFGCQTAGGTSEGTTAQSTTAETTTAAATTAHLVQHDGTGANASTASAGKLPEHHRPAKRADSSPHSR